MSGRFRAAVALLAAMVAGSGLAYAIIRYLLENDDPFSAYNHPLQPWALDLHVVAGPVLLFLLGWSWGAHEPRRPDSVRARRWSGRLLLALVTVMVGSGYLLQASSAETLLVPLRWLHGVSGSAFFLALGSHGWLQRRRARAAAREVTLSMGAVKPPQG